MLHEMRSDEYFGSLRKKIRTHLEVILKLPFHCRNWREDTHGFLHEPKSHFKHVEWNGVSFEGLLPLREDHSLHVFMCRISVRFSEYIPNLLVALLLEVRLCGQCPEDPSEGRSGGVVTWTFLKIFSELVGIIRSWWFGITAFSLKIKEK